MHISNTFPHFHRTFDEFVSESKVHGWPSFRDEEVIWDNVRALGDGETVSVAGTHLGHNLPDARYFILLKCLYYYHSLCCILKKVNYLV